MSANRRDFLRNAAAASAVVGAGSGALPSSSSQEPKADDRPAREIPEAFRPYSRERPSYGGPVGDPTYLGKLVPGRRGPGEPPVPITSPDIPKLPWRLVDGVKEYHITCEHVRREFLPGYHMDVWGYNGTLPGPVIEATQGDRVRFIVDNRLPEPTSVHWHGLELPIQYDGVPGMTQDMIPPGGRFVYEFDLHQAGTFFYHSHIAMQEAAGMVGFFVIHPAVAFDPPVDRDFVLLFQNFFIPPNQTVPDTMAMEWNWHTINGRSGPFATPLVCRLGERVRIRLIDFSPMQHHPIHLHGHTFWITGREGARIPQEAWQPRNTELIAVAQATDVEFVAFNPGDWLLHCHMVHHMMNHMVRQVGPRIREGVDVTRYYGTPGDRPPASISSTAAGLEPPGYPQKMQGMQMPPEAMARLWSRREVQGARAGFHEPLRGLMTAVRVLPDDLYDRLMHSDEPIPKGAFFDEIVRRSGEPPAPAPLPDRPNA